MKLSIILGKLREYKNKFFINKKIHSSEIFIASFGINAYDGYSIKKHVDTHGIVNEFVGEAIIPIDGYYNFEMVYKYDCYDIKEYFPVIIVRLNDYQLFVKSNLNRCGCPISDSIYTTKPFFLKKGDRITVEMPVDKDFRWELEITNNIK